MTTVDLGAPAPVPTSPPPAGLLSALPRRVALTLPELRLVASAAGDAPLPFAVGRAAGSQASSALADRLGASPAGSDEEAYVAVLAGMADPAESLTRRGLLVDGVMEPGLRGAVGLLATPTLAVDLEVAAGATRAVAWHRQDGEAVATLSTADGLVFELAWFALAHWPAELARVAVPPEDLPSGPGDVPATGSLPLELADAGAEALRSGRGDLLPELVRQSEGPTLVDGVEVDEPETLALLGALHAETRGRLRVLVADLRDPTAGAGVVVGVRSWLLLSDGWRSLHTAEVPGGGPLLRFTTVTPSDLAGDLAPLLAQAGSEPGPPDRERP